MVFTRLFFVLVGLGVIPIALSYFYHNTIEIALFYNGAVIFSLLLDYLLTKKSNVLEVKRLCDEKLSIGVENKISIQLRNRESRVLHIVVRDEYPDEFKVNKLILNCKIEPFSQAEQEYTVIPFQRGDYCFGAINVRYTSRLGFFLRQFRVNEKMPIKVYPNLQHIKRGEFSGKRGSMLEVGLKNSLLKGSGTNFEGLREYVVDDEFRKISWTATARRAKLIVNEYEIEKSQNIILVIDAGRLMHSQIGGLSKLDHAIDAALMLGHLGVTKDDRVGLLTFAEDVKAYLPPRKGRKQLFAILDSLYNLRPVLAEANYGKVIQYLALKNRKRSLVCVFTDLIDPDVSRDLLRYLGSLVPKHLPICVSIRDPEIYNLSGKSSDTGWDICQKAVASRIIADRERAASILRRQGIMVVDVLPENISTALVSKYLELKKKALL